MMFIKVHKKANKNLFFNYQLVIALLNMNSLKMEYLMIKINFFLNILCYRLTNKVCRHRIARPYVCQIKN